MNQKSLNPKFLGLFFGAFFATLGGAVSAQFHLKSFKIDLNHEIPRLRTLVGNTRLPEKALYPDAGPNYGIELDTLRELQNEYKHYTAVVEGQTVHFVHEKSKDPNAIPVIILHGWPGSFYEFLPVIKPLTQPSKTSTGKKVSYHVVVPFLPGFVFSSAPPANWTVDDTARIYNTLMTEVLGYSTFAVQGTDWGCAIGYSLYSSYNTTVRAAQFVFLPFPPPLVPELAVNNITLSPLAQFTLQRFTEWSSTDTSYLLDMTFKPNDIGLALYDNPVGQLAYISGKIKRWSDPRAGTPPSVLDNTALLTSVSLHVLNHSFLSSAWIYAQNPHFFRTEYTKPVRVPQYVEKVGNLVLYTENDFGGHFPGLDNPPALIADIWEMGD
ncbi:Alpha/Beta hydrolase protein [Mycena rebaudengoi]|nr:Alpha/Beta hydrolase protein [Mycena rebaudengoi]